MADPTPPATGAPPPAPPAPSASVAPLLGSVLEALRSLERALSERETAMAGEIRTALEATEAVARDLRDARAEAEESRAVRARQAELDQDLAMAEKVTRTLIPRSVRSDDLTVEVRYVPMRGVGGDTCTVYRRGEKGTYLTVADVTGHGIAAALLATRVTGHARTLLDRSAGPAELLAGLNDFCHAHFSETGLYLTLFAVLVDTRVGELRFAGAGHPPAFLYRRATGEVEALPSRHTMLGVLPELGPEAEEGRVPISRGDRLLLYTDGITESRSRSGAFLGPGALGRLLRDTRDRKPEEVADEVLSRAAGFRRGPPEDDMLALVAEVG